LNDNNLEMIIQKFEYEDILVVGTVSNVSKSINQEIYRLKRALSDVKKIRFYLVESDSTDSTISELSILKSTLDNFDFLSLGSLKETIPDRLDRIRFCRNKYIDFIRSCNLENCPTYTIVADLDGMNTAISKTGVKSCFKRLDWDVVTANQTFGYYDILALRKDGWQEVDWTEEYKLAKEALVLNKINHFKIMCGLRKFLYFESLKHRLVYSKMKIIKKRSNWISVNSAFGGLAIYKTEIFHRYNYSKEFYSVETDHVSLNRKIVKAGGKIYINPMLINSHFNEYNLNRMLLFRLTRNFIWRNGSIYRFFVKYFKGMLSKIIFNKR
jgi:hypothetical protein